MMYHREELGKRSVAGRKPLSGRRRFLFGMIYAGYIAGLFWLGERLFWRFLFGVPVTQRPDVSAVWDHFYPEIRQTGVMDAPRGKFDVLLLGGSVLEQAGGAIQDALRRRYGETVRVFSLAKSAHTSRDSYWKSKRLAARSFDLVILYDGINDARMNCSPREVFRDDYTHCTWYREFERRLAAGRVTIPELVTDTAKKGLTIDRPTESELDFGLDVKTGEPFHNNIAAILDRSPEKGHKFVLMTFATHIPPGYSRGEFERGGFGYGQGTYHLAIELWGRPQGVSRAMDVHNRTIRDLAKSRDGVIFVDQDAMLKKDGGTFSDVCHLTHAGCVQFAANLVDSLPTGLDSSPGG